MQPVTRRPDQVTDEELRQLYTALDGVGLRPSDLIREVRRDNKRIRNLGELSSSEARRLLKEIEKHRPKGAS